MPRPLFIAVPSGDVNGALWRLTIYDARLRCRCVFLWFYTTRPGDRRQVAVFASQQGQWGSLLRVVFVLRKPCSVPLFTGSVRSTLVLPLSVSIPRWSPWQLGRRCDTPPPEGDLLHSDAAVWFSSAFSLLLLFGPLRLLFV